MSSLSERVARVVRRRSTVAGRRRWLVALLGVVVLPGFAAREPLRVCADPNNLPFSNEKGEGFENKLAELVARDLGTTLTYVWRPQRRGFVRNTLNDGKCDLVMGVPSGYDPVKTSRPYYRSTYVFVYRADRGLHVASLADTALRHLRIGIHVVGDDNPPPMTALARRGIRDNVEGYTIYGDYADPNPPARLIEAVAKGEVDVAIAWGPLAGYFAKREGVPLTVVPVPAASDLSGQPWTFPIAMGMRRSSTMLAEALDRVLVADAPEIRRILESYDVPLRPVDAPASPRRAAAAGVARP
jgi:quinoprotein dehydrogenase-associated probable ABC transporter substrate-binding protein